MGWIMTQRRGGVPVALAAMPLRTVRVKDALGTYADPAHQFARLTRQGSLRRVAHGYYVVVPQDQVGKDWNPGLEAIAAGVAAADFGPRQTALMGVSAARVHGAIPRAIATALVAVPRQRAPVALIGREATVQFVRRDTDRLDVESVATELGRALVTTPEQTVLDLARRPRLGGVEGDVQSAIRALLPRCSQDTLERLASEQRMRATLNRVNRNYE